MRCPFLREAQVRFCRASAYRKLIVRSEATAAERCSSPDWRNCGTAANHVIEDPLPATCPFLQVSPVQYCSVAPVSRFVPYTDSAQARCNTDHHKYCDVYLDLASPEGRDHASPEGSERTVLGVRIPEGYAFLKNHVWIERHTDGGWHAGIDDFLVRLLGRVDRVTFEKAQAVLQVKGLGFPVVLPPGLTVTGVNRALRLVPDLVLRFPYERGWLYEGRSSGAWQGGTLLEGEATVEWIREEFRTLSEYVQQHIASGPAPGMRLAADGGVPVEGLLSHLKRAEAVRLFEEFFGVQRWGGTE